MSTVGTVEVIATIDTSAYRKGADEIDKQNDKIEGSTEKSSKNMSGSLKSVAKVGFGALIGAAVAAGAAIISNVDSAIKRVDTLGNSSRAFENLGFSADSVQKAMSALEKSIQGLPTSLDQGVRSVQLLAATTGDIGRSADIFSAINNAVIGFGGTAEDVEGAVVQLSQAFSNGRVDAETWNSLIDRGLGPTLNALGKQMGLTSGELKKGLSEGTVSVETFQDSLLKLNTDGGGGMKSLQQIAKDSTSGISTSFDNMNTAITRGVAAIIDKIGSQNIANAITNIGKFFEQSSKAVTIGIGILLDAFNVLFTILAPFINYLRENTQLFEVLKTGVIILAGVIGGALVIAVGSAIIAVTAIAYAIDQAIKFVQNLMIGFINLVNVIRSLFGGLGSFFAGVWNNIIGLFSSVGTAVGNAIGNAFRSVINGILRYAANTINGFINAINVAIGLINNIPGVKIGKLGNLPIPQLAEGGIVTSPTLAMIGEGRESEAVIPLSKLDKMIDGNGGGNQSITISVSGTFATSKQEQRNVAELIATRLKEAQNARALSGGRA